MWQLLRMDLVSAKVEVSCTSWLLGQPNPRVHHAYEHTELTHTLLGDRITPLRSIYTNGLES